MNKTAHYRAIKFYGRSGWAIMRGDKVWVESTSEKNATVISAELQSLLDQIDQLVEALAPFTQEGLLHQSEAQAKMGDSAPVYGREKAILTHGHFRKAAALLSKFKAPTPTEK